MANRENPYVNWLLADPLREQFEYRLPRPVAFFGMLG
jgi:hypothetical protein